MTKEIHCSFCGLPKPNLIEGLEGFICQDCLEQALDSMPVENFEDNHFMKPHEIKEALDKYVIAQDDAKKKLAVEVYNHYKRINKKTSTSSLLSDVPNPK